ncbi:Rpn family recombination-promoting nuclease/putative transposase [Spirosoma rhododendri]|uniref:Rpn family recombination-promoting nuclease/putative transposase n=1 Tax=Spirosoma rhododendri TaxID=2728024 RepID=A0A7L5DS14_9BACT|nr:Rpn family recombination-promoting nuclease/putative transposase [Spirosoma rhododendri]QJD80925.1 Rpn family recombination-promoting nuclease/putative transposase [Spirosoma rhododendri]
MDLYKDEKRFIPLISDYGFKVTFGNESDTRFLRKALQALINSPNAIQEATFVQNEIQGITRDSRSGIYDLFCTDEVGNQFIVEMQLGRYPEFIQRMKFYALYRLNTLIQKGEYSFDKLPRIYCIGILAATTLHHVSNYHNVAVLKNANNQLIDDQITYITLELSKFSRELSAISSDLDKLAYTMKTLHEITDTTQFPPFWDEEWLRLAIDELDKRSLSPEQRLQYEMTISANAQVVQAEKRKIAEARESVKTETVRNALRKGLDTTLIAEIAGVSVDFVNAVRKQLLSE